jgi:hypothetical protein
LRRVKVRLSHGRARRTLHVTVFDADVTVRGVKEFNMKNRIKGEPLVPNMNFAL